MSTDERAPTPSPERVRAVLVEMRREDELELQRWERWVQLYATGAIPMPLSDSLEAVQTERDRRAADVAALSAAIDAMDRQHEDSALLDLMAKHGVWATPYSDGTWGIGWLPTNQLGRVLARLCNANPNGWPDPRSALRAAAAVLDGKDGGER